MKPISHKLYSIFSLISVHVTRAFWKPDHSDPNPGNLGGPITDILVIKIDGIGDFVLVIPLLRGIRLRYPGAKITLVVSDNVKGLAATCPYVDRLFSIKIENNRLFRPFIMFWRVLALAKRELSLSPYDLAIIPRVGADESSAAFLAYLSKAKVRIGYSEKSDPKRVWFNRGFDQLMTINLPGGFKGHELLSHFQLARIMDIKIYSEHLELWPTHLDADFADSTFRKWNTLNQASPIIAICPGAGSGRRQWPLSKYRYLVLHLVQEFQAKIILLGGRSERFLGAQFSRDEFPTLVNLIGATTLQETTALLKHCDLYIGSDSGCMHLAAAVGVPVLEISAHPMNGDFWHVNSPRRFGPWGVPNMIIQPLQATEPCVVACESRVPHCILSVTTQEVWSGACTLLRSILKDSAL